MILGMKKPVYYQHVHMDKYRLKVCPKTLKIEELQDNGKRRSHSIIRPVNALAAERLGLIYSLPADVITEIQRVIENPIPLNPLAWRNL